MRGKLVSCTLAHASCGPLAIWAGGYGGLSHVNSTLLYLHACILGGALLRHYLPFDGALDIVNHSFRGGTPPS